MIWLRALSYERRTIARLVDAGANQIDRAILLERGGAVADFVHHRLERAGVLKPVAADRYYWDELAYAELTRRRRRRAMVVLIVLLCGMLMLLYM